MNKIVVINDWLIKYLTLEPYIFAKKLIDFGFKMIKLSDFDPKNIEKTIILFITYDDYDFKAYKNNNIIIYKIDDLYPYKKIRKDCIDNCDYLIGPYQYLFNSLDTIKMYENINLKKSFYIPYSYINEYLHNIKLNTNPIKKVFVSGATSSIYPLRLLAKKMNNIISLDHPSYFKYKHDLINEKYYNELNKYICCFCDGSIYRYVLLKVFEITCVGSLLLIDDTIINELNILGFYDGVNCITCNKNNLQNKINFIIDEKNIEMINDIRKKGMENSLLYHSVNNRVEQFIKIIENIELNHL